MLWQGDLKFVFLKLLQSVIDRELEKSEADLVLTSLVGVNRAYEFIWIFSYYISVKILPCGLSLCTSDFPSDLLFDFIDTSNAVHQITLLPECSRLLCTNWLKVYV